MIHSIKGTPGTRARCPFAIHGLAVGILGLGRRPQVTESLATLHTSTNPNRIEG